MDKKEKQNNLPKLTVKEIIKKFVKPSKHRKVFIHPELEIEKINEKLNNINEKLNNISLPSLTTEQILEQCQKLANVKNTLAQHCFVKNSTSMDMKLQKQQNQVCINIINRIDDMVNSLFEQKH